VRTAGGKELPKTKRCNWVRKIFEGIMPEVFKSD
jgi:hypothetical protein